MNKNEKDAGVNFEHDLYIYFKYYKDTNTVEVYKNGELISSGGGGVTPEQLMEILEGYVSKPELIEALSNYLTQDDLEGYVTNDALIVKLNDYITNDTEATDDALGLIKVNSTEFITLNEEGQLVVGGRLGQFTDGGLYYPTNAEPSAVGGSALLITDGAKNLSSGGRTFGIMAGTNLTCKNSAVGTTEYRLTNNQQNRFYCFAGQNGRLSIDQNDAITNGTALITNISFANGDPIRAYFGPTESDNDIIITVDRTVNPIATTRKLRIYGNTSPNDVFILGQGCGSGGGKAVVIGQSCFAGGNQCFAFGNSAMSLSNNSVALGHTQLVNQQYCLAAGQGHDFTNASNGTSAVGICSELDINTAFAVGNGVFNANGNITRSNAFEVLKDGSIVLKSPNNTRYKINVADDGTLTTTVITE